MQLAHVNMLGPWKNVGYFPTPEQLVDDLVLALVAQLKHVERGAHLSVLDACAGDGRLGLSLLKKLAELGVYCDLTCIEVDPARIPVANGCPANVTWINDNFLTRSIDKVFDIVVSNPPYLVLSRRDADTFGIDWSAAVDGGRNLYSLSVSRALDWCRPGGVIGLIAPHGWLRNVTMAKFRHRMNELAQSVEISAYQTRRLFDKVNQDTSVQIITRRTGSETHDAARVMIRYGNGKFSDASLSALHALHGEVRVRVGPFVWNREKEAISDDEREPRLPAIYGGNITTWHHLDLRVGRYSKRQYLSRAKVSAGSISVGPCLLVKRSMRGEPGRWEVDCAYVPEGFEVVPENHVIVVEYSDAIDMSAGELLCHLKYFLQSSCKHQGHPNLSAKSVREALSPSSRLLTKLSVKVD